MPSFDWAGGYAVHRLNHPGFPERHGPLDRRRRQWNPLEGPPSHPDVVAMTLSGSPPSGDPRLAIPAVFDPAVAVIRAPRIVDGASAGARGW